MWEGAGADAAIQRARTAQVKVRGFAEDLRSAAATASGAANEIALAKKQALLAIGEAHAQGFVVGEDLSVTDRQVAVSAEEQAARQAQAETLAADIRVRAIALAAVDLHAAAKISAAAEGLGGARFAETDGDQRVVHAVDFKQTPETEEPGDQAGDDNPTHPNYPDHKPNGEWAPGNSGLDGDVEAQKTFDEMESNGIPVVRDKVAVRVTDPGTGHTYTRYYDGLRPTGVPGQYIGIEHKVNNSPITKNQQAVDDLVRSGVPASGQFHGEPITVTDVQVIRVERLTEAGNAPVVTGGIPEKVIEAAPKGVDDWGTNVPRQEWEDMGFPFNVFDKFVPRDPNDPDNWA